MCKQIITYVILSWWTLAWQKHRGADEVLMGRSIEVLMGKSIEVLMTIDDLL